MVIGVAIPSDHNLQERATEEMSKYVDTQIEYQRIGNKKVEVQVMIGTTTLVEKNWKKYHGRMHGHHNIHNLWRSVILETTHLLRKVLSIKSQ